MSDEEIQSENPTPRQEPSRTQNPAPATPDWGSEIRKALDAMVEGGEIEFASDSGPVPAAAPPRQSLPREDEETRFERFLAARDAKNKADSEEKQFRDKVTKQLERKPRWFDPWRP